MLCAESLQSCWILCDPMDHQASLSIGFSRQKYWSGLLFPSGDLSDLGIKPESPVSPALQADSLLLSHWESHKRARLFKGELEDV